MNEIFPIDADCRDIESQIKKSIAIESSTVSSPIGLTIDSRPSKCLVDIKTGSLVDETQFDR